MIRKSNNIAVRMSDEDYAMLEELMRSYNIPTPGELMRYLIKKEHARIFIDSNARKTIATTPTKMRVRGE